MAEGADFRSFAGKVGVTEPTIHAWKKQYPEFQEAYALAIERSYSWWEEIARKYLFVRKDEDKVDTGLFVINMRNRFGWLTRDKDEKSGEQERPDAFSEIYRTWEKRKSDR
jgi:hypothetical protein